MLNWTERIIRMRKEVPEIGWGDFAVIATRDPAVLAMRYDWRNNSVLFVHNLASSSRARSAFASGFAGDGRRARWSICCQRGPQPRRRRRPAQPAARRPTAIAGTGSAAWTICSSAAMWTPRRQPSQVMAASSLRPTRFTEDMMAMTDALVAARHHLPDLSALLPGHQSPTASAISRASSSDCLI